jgi:hypothetical protein
MTTWVPVSSLTPKSSERVLRRYIGLGRVPGSIRTISSQGPVSDEPASQERAIGRYDELRIRRTDCPVDEQDQAAWRLLTTHIDKMWSLADCASFVVMKERSITTALTTDHHFEQAGFVRLLK